MILLIVSRKKHLLNELTEHQFHYDNLLASRSETEKELINLKQHIENITRNELKEMQNSILSSIEEKLENITFSVNSFSLDIQIDTRRIEQAIKQMGKIVTCKIPKYSEMKTLVVAVKSELKAPRGVALEDGSDLIFVCGNFNSCVKVFDSTCQFVNDFGSNQLYRPWGILLHEDHIYVTDLDKCTLLKYQRSNYQFLLSVGKKGSDSGEFNCPCQLAIGPDECLYVPENENNRISVLDTDLNFNRHFEHEKVISPVDVKFNEEEMFVLSSKSIRVVNSFNIDGDLIKSFAFNVKFVAYFFTIDCIGNIVVSLCGEHSVVVFNRDGKVLYSIAKDGHEKGCLHFPYGICITRNGNLIVASDNRNYGLQIF